MPVVFFGIIARAVSHLDYWLATSEAVAQMTYDEIPEAPWKLHAANTLYIKDRRSNTISSSHRVEVGGLQIIAPHP